MLTSESVIFPIEYLNCNFIKLPRSRMKNENYEKPADQFIKKDSMITTYPVYMS